jgi:hypothetical protein
MKLLIKFIIELTLQISNSFSVHRQGVFHCTECEEWETTVIGHRNCQKHLDPVSTNKFEELVHHDGFILRKLHSRVVQ